MAPVIHGPKGCTCSVANAYKMRGCEYRGAPLEPAYHGAAITLDTYSHVLPGIQAAAAGGFDEGLQKAAEKALSERVG